MRFALSVSLNPSIAINRGRLQTLIAIALLFLAGSAQAFNVTLNNLERSIYAAPNDGFFSYPDESVYTSTGFWSDSVQVQVGGAEASANLTSSFVPEAGDYSNYEISMAGSLTAEGAGPSSASASVDLDLAFDQAVTLNLACSGEEVGGYTRVIIDSGQIPVLDCGNNLTLSAGTYDFRIISLVGAYGGQDSLDFNNALSITAVPIPAAVWLFGSALAGLGWMKRKQTV
jgi:hypothetical protein